jgi:hypothetical protein
MTILHKIFTIFLLSASVSQVIAGDLKLKKMQTIPQDVRMQAPVALPATQPDVALPANKLPADGSSQMQKTPIVLPQAKPPAALPNNGAAQVFKPVENFGGAKNLAVKTINLTPQLSWNDIKNEPNSSVLVDQNGNKISIGDLKAVIQEASKNRSGAELNMIEIQSLVSKRATALQLTTNMMNGINESQKSIAGNIGRDGGRPNPTTKLPLNISVQALTFQGMPISASINTATLSFTGQPLPTEVTTQVLSF